MGITPSYRAYTHTQRTLLRADGRTKPIDCSSNKPASSHLDLHYSIQYSSACGQRIFRESDRINSPTCQSSASGSPLYELAITTFPPALFFLSRSLKICQIINVCFWLIKASRINSTFFGGQIAWMFRASRLLKGRKDSFLPAGQVYALGLSSLGGKLAMPCSRCGGSAPGPSLFLLSLGGRR